MNAGLTAIGKVTVAGTAEVSGLDGTPAEWLTATQPVVTCPTPSDKAGIKYNGTISINGAADTSGAPAVQKDPTLTTDNILGGSTFDELKSLATLVLTADPGSPAPAVTGSPSRCNTSLQSNWGAPITKTSPCFTYFPIIYYNGNLSISGGIGQGILLVDGDLTAQGGFVFYGPVIARGSVSTRGNNGGQGAKFYGGIVAQNVDLDDNRLTGGATVLYSSCALDRALKGSASVVPLNERSWVQLYN